MNPETSPAPERGDRGAREPRAPPSWILPTVILATLTVGGWFIIQTLSDNAKLEDCTMSGRRNCVPPIDTSKLGR